MQGLKESSLEWQQPLILSTGQHSPRLFRWDRKKATDHSGKDQHSLNNNKRSDEASQNTAEPRLDARNCTLNNKTTSQLLI